ncbi:hypothetical protein B0H10DRAFT_2160566 [Mycena sp. CBHHK59/15]|nr:hypothetical protein B0H10DRAFT_2160566 [Mycena sp. CBHHK59/15]
MPSVRRKAIVSSDNDIGLSNAPINPPESTTPAPVLGELEESAIAPRYSPGQIGKAYAKGVRKRQDTLALAAQEAKTKEVFDKVLGQLADNKLSFGDLMLYVFDPIYKQGQTRWNGFFRCPGLATKILDLWVSRENSETAWAEVDVWAGDYVAEWARNEAKEITKSKALQTGRTVDGSYVDRFSMQKMYDFLQLHVKTAMKVFDAFATSARNARSNLPAHVAKRALILTSTALTLLGEYSYKNNFSRCIMALYLYASGAQRQTISVLAHLGISESYQNLIKKARFLINHRSHDIDPEDPLPMVPPSTPVLSDTPYTPPDPAALSSAIAALWFVRMGTLRQLSGSMRDMARSISATGLYAASYDNINMVFRAAKQVLGKNDSQENGTCATIWPLWKARLEDMKIKDFNTAFDKAPPLSIKDILLSAPELELMDKSLPTTPDKIDLHKTPLHPLTAWNIDQSTIIANEEVTDAIHDELQLTIARLHSLLNICAGHEGGYSGFGWGFFITHWGVSHRSTHNPGSLSFHNTHLHCAPIVLSSLPPFCVCCDLVFVSLYAGVLHCLLLVTGASTLDQCADSIESFEELEAHAQTIQQKYANTSAVSDLRWQRNIADGSVNIVPRDEIYENACLLLHDALVSREFTDSIKAGDSILALSYRGNGCTKYVYEMMHLIHNLTHVWPPAIRKIVLNNWLVNPTGNPFSWVEADLMQEHMNYWIKTIYHAHGSSASWEWLEMIAPCISVLRRLSTTIRQVLGSDQGSKHEPTDLKEDIVLLMDSLAEHEVYQGDDSPTPDVVSVEVQQLTDSSANPLTEYNTMFTRLQSQLHLKPLVSRWSECEPMASAGPLQPLATAVLPPSIPDPEALSQNHDDGATPDNSDDEEDIENVEQPLALEQAMDEEDEATLTRDTVADVALDMDGSDDGFLFPEDDEDF